MFRAIPYGPRHSQEKKSIWIFFTMLNEIPRRANSFHWQLSHTRAIIYTCWKSFWGARPGPGPSVHLHLIANIAARGQNGGVWCRPERVVPSWTTSRMRQSKQAFACGSTPSDVPMHTFVLFYYYYLFHFHYICTCMHACIHTCMHAYIHACMHTYIHTSIHTYIHTCMHTYIHMYVHTCIHPYMHTYIHTYIYIHIHMHTCRRSCEVFLTSPMNRSRVCMFA